MNVQCCVQYITMRVRQPTFANTSGKQLWVTNRLATNRLDNRLEWQLILILIN